MPRVVVTGLGAISPLGVGFASSWESLIKGRSGIGTIESFDASRLQSRIAGECRDFRVEDHLSPKEAERGDRFIHLALAAARMACDHAGIGPDRRAGAAVFLGSGIGGLLEIVRGHSALLEGGPRRISPYWMPSILINLGAGQVAVALGARGPCLATVSACASGLHAIGEAFHLIRSGQVNVAFAGGSEAALSELTFAGFEALGTLSRRNDDPTRASRPFDRRRDGFVMAEGAAVLVLEALPHALDREGRILAEMVGYGATGDAYHLTAPRPDGDGLARAMRLALEDAALAPERVDYVNAHGTSTRQNDLCETRAIKAALGPHASHVAVSSTKSLTGHLLGAAGALESAFCVEALRRGMLPATANLEDPDPDCDLDYIPGAARHAPIKVALNNSAGFGGANACVAFTRWNGERSHAERTVR
jgi:3-oxoacyl-[acyl-carrier-protein] synthase II